MGPIRQSLSNKGTSGSARPRNLRIGIQGKTQNDQKEIGIAGFPCKIPIFVASFYLSYRPYGILTAAPGSPGVVFYLCGFNARFLAAKSARNRFKYAYWYNSP